MLSYVKYDSCQGEGSNVSQMLRRGWLWGDQQKETYLCVPEMSGDVVCTLAKLDGQDLMHS